MTSPRSYSLSEVEATARKATRGAGLSWGMAEDAARATRWLCAFGLDGCAALAAELAAVDGTGLAELAPRDLTGDWRGRSGRLCPLIAGAALSDAAALWAPTGVTMHDVTAPMLLLPFAAMAARALETPVTLRWDAVTAITDGDALSLTEADPGMTGRATVMVTAGGTPITPRPRHSRATPRPEDWAALNAWAGRTYAPASEMSRRKGAGAEVSDND